MTTGQRIKEARKKSGLTQAKLAAKLGVSSSFIAQYENGLRNPKNETLQRIATALDVSMDYLLGKEKASITEDERKRRLDQLADEINEKKRDMLNSFDKMISIVRRLICMDSLSLYGVSFSGVGTKQLQKEIDDAIVKFAETATFDEKIDFILRFDVIGSIFSNKLDSAENFGHKHSQQAPESTPPAPEGKDTTPEEKPPTGP